MHSILKRQIKRYLGEHPSLPPELQNLLESVSKTYTDFDDDRAFLNRSFEISSKEFLEKSRLIEETRAKVEEQAKTLAIEVKNRTKELNERVTELEEAKLAMLNILEDLNIEKKNLTEAKAKYGALLASIGDGIIYTDSSGKIVLMNKAAEKMLGWKIDEAIGRVYDEVVLLEDKNGTIVPIGKKPLRKAFEGHTTTTTTMYLLSKNKIKFPVAITISPVILDNNIIGAVEVFRDITKEKEVDKSKSEFVSLASHQLRTPLTSIGWYIEMLQSGDVGNLNDKQHKFLSEIYAGNKRMVGLVDALLNIYRMELGTFVVETKPTDIILLVRGVVDEQKQKIEAKKLKLSEKYAKGIPLFNADPKLLQILFQNLISNAVKYTPEGGKITIAISLADDNGQISPSNRKPTDPSHVLIKVSDTGYGIPEKQQNQIFTKFFRADNVREKDTDGIGLGLYIAKTITHNALGNIWFESVEGKGTTFYLTLPLLGMKKKENIK